MSNDMMDMDNLSLGALPPAPEPDMSAPQNNMMMSPQPDAPPQPVVAESGTSQPVRRMRLGEQLVHAGVITMDQLNVALREQKKTSMMLGEQLVSLGFISSSFLQSFLAESSGIEQFDPHKMMVDPEAIALLPKDIATRLQVLPVTYDQHVFVMATSDPHDVITQDKLRQYLPRGTSIKPLLCAPKTLADAIDSAYGYATSVDAIIKELETGQIDLNVANAEQDYAHPIVRLINALVYDAVKIGASDLHFEPEENFVRLRLRVDGVLREVQTFHREFWNAMAQRIKIISDMNIADKMNPQDGRFNLTVGGRTADFRVSSLPTVWGENLVLRVLDKSAGIKSLEELGFSEHNLKQIRRAIAHPEGIIIVTGPTGSGKTTSLYSMINAVNSPEVNIMTLEDPVEYSLPMIRQSAVRDATGLTFANGVKALLRQDPDIIFIGEVRDEPTAEQALKAAMTGHQVFTTLHTNDCFAAIPRLVDLGLKPGMMAGSIIASFAQRLIRRLCPDCKRPATATAEECKLLGVDPMNPPTIYHAAGCMKCGNLGYKGRLAIAEILIFDEDLDDIVSSEGNKSALKAEALKKGFVPMAEDGVQKVLQGTSSLQALMKVVNLSDRLD